MNIHIPESIEGAKDALIGIGQLLTAKEWERAAIVYAFTTDEVTGRGNRGSSTALSARSFAGLGIKGLESDKTVRAYRKAWDSAMQDGAPEAHPGDDLEMPSLPWKDVFGETTPKVQERVARAFIRDNSDAIDRIVGTDEELAAKVAGQVLDAPEVAANVAEQIVTKDPVVAERIAEHHADWLKDHPRERYRKPPNALVPSKVVEHVTEAIEEFFGTTFNMERQSFSYRDVINEVLANFGSPSLRATGAPTARADQALVEALRSMASEAQGYVDAAQLPAEVAK